MEAVRKQTFSSASIIELEKMVANWLKTHINIKILKVSQSVTIIEKESLQIISLKYSKI